MATVKRTQLAALALAAIGLGVPAGAQTPPPAGPVYPAAHPKGHYAALDALPDWGGVWTLKFSPANFRQPPPDPVGPYLEQYNKAKAEAAAHGGEFPHSGSYCTPPGMPYIMGVAQYPIEFLFTPGKVTMLFEAWMQVRHVFTDGRPHLTDPDPTFYGNEIGHWEGDTLVVDTIAIKPTVTITAGVGHSDKEHIVERIHLKAGDPDTLIDEITVTDPEALAKPWTERFEYERHRDLEQLEFICAENDRNPVTSNGHADFTPGGG
jgi:hypothetical protein